VFEGGARLKFEVNLKGKFDHESTTRVVFLRNFISSLPVKRGGSLSFLVRTISNVLAMEIDWTETQLKLSYDIGFVYRRTDRHGEISISPYNFVAGGIKMG
jgi:hypothetical protein